MRQWRSSMKTRVSLALVCSSTLIACGTASPLFARDFQPDASISTTGFASPGRETRVSLDDGAAIVVPADSINEDTTVKIERNPQEFKSLPPFGDNVVRLSNFYRFELSSRLVGPVELVIPFDQKRVPQTTGYLSVGWWVDSGWEFLPAHVRDGYVVIMTDQLGGLIVVWHSTNP
jgi:hypothetical protein